MDSEVRRGRRDLRERREELRLQPLLKPPRARKGRPGLKERALRRGRPAGNLAVQEGPPARGGRESRLALGGRDASRPSEQNRGEGRAQAALRQERGPEPLGVV